VIIGRSEAIERARQLVARYAPTPLPILIVGPTGSGKELVAREIHRLSLRTGKLTDVNCGALPRDMAESLLFGHRRGAFTGAVEATTGYVSLADRGTLFLDELGSLPIEVQAKLLRVLETGEVHILGSDVSRTIDLRVVAAAQDTLADSVRVGRFRRDLFQRVAGVVIKLPPLRRRIEDLVPLAEYFANETHRTLESGVDTVLYNYTWPGNVRELRFAIDRAGRLVDNGTLSAAAVAEAIELGVAPTPSEAGVSLGQIAAAGAVSDWHGGRTAGKLGISRATLYRYLRSAGLTLRELRQSQMSQDCLETFETLRVQMLPDAP